MSNEEAKQTAVGSFFRRAGRATWKFIKRHGPAFITGAACGAGTMVIVSMKTAEEYVELVDSSTAPPQEVSEQMYYQ